MVIMHCESVLTHEKGTRAYVGNKVSEVFTNELSWMQTGNGCRGGLPTNIIPNLLRIFKTVPIQSFLLLGRRS
jgi:hypothetical protein